MLTRSDKVGEAEIEYKEVSRLVRPSMLYRCRKCYVNENWLWCSWRLPVRKQQEDTRQWCDEWMKSFCAFRRRRPMIWGLLSTNLPEGRRAWQMALQMLGEVFSQNLMHVLLLVNELGKHLFHLRDWHEWQSSSCSVKHFAIQEFCSAILVLDQCGCVNVFFFLYKFKDRWNTVYILRLYAG